jgi:putative aldouronate transport system substrate-binding protein
MLWEEDILDREFASIDTDGHRMRNAQNRLGSYRGKLNGQLNSYMLNLANEIPGFSLLATEPIRSAGGMQLHPGVEGIVRLDVIGGIVTSTSQFPREAVLFTDWFYDWTPPTGGGFQNAFGIEGNTFVFNDDRTEFFYSDYVLNNPDGLTPSEVLARYTTRGQHAGFVDAIGTLRMWHDNTVESFRTISPFYAGSLPWKMPNLAALTDDDHRQIRSIMADVDTYVDEMVNNFIMGRRPISEFDSFVAEVENMGIHEVLEIYNRAFALHGGR